MGVAHLAFDLGTRCERCHRVDDHDVDGAGAHQHVDDLECLLAGVGLADEQLVDVDPDGAGVDRIHGVLGIDVGTDAAVALRLGHDVHRQRRLARRLRPEDLDHAAPRQAADAEGEVERQRPRLDGLDAHRGLLTHPHDGSLAELLVDGCQRHIECLFAIVAHCRSPFPAWFMLLTWRPDCTTSIALTATIRKGCYTVSPSGDVRTTQV
jgi:hypothetical protein